LRNLAGGVGEPKVERVVPNALSSSVWTQLRTEPNNALGTTRSTPGNKKPGREARAEKTGELEIRAQRTTRAPPPFMSFSTSFCVAIEVSPGVVDANAPCAAP
jgi:hypothetical protein